LGHVTRATKRRSVSALCAVLASALALGGVSAAATAPAKKKHAPKQKGPTGKQITMAIARAEQSADLWATINICNSANYPNYIGIRGQIPGLGFTTQVYMDVQVQYYDSATKKFIGTGNDQRLSLGRATHGVHQGGVRFPLQPPAAGDTYVLRGAIAFEWKLSGKLIGRTIKTTTGPLANVDFADPPGYSAATCTIAGAAATPPAQRTDAGRS
jgi:hypothetical protein